MSKVFDRLQMGHSLLPGFQLVFITGISASVYAVNSFILSSKLNRVFQMATNCFSTFGTDLHYICLSFAEQKSMNICHSQLFLLCR
jgi:hypothetical protein